MRIHQPEANNVPNGATIGDLVAGVLAAGILFGESGRYLYRGFMKKGEGNAGHG